MLPLFCWDLSLAEIVSCLSLDELVLLGFICLVALRYERTRAAEQRN